MFAKYALIRGNADLVDQLRADLPAATLAARTVRDGEFGRDEGAVPPLRLVAPALVLEGPGPDVVLQNLPRCLAGHIPLLDLRAVGRLVRRVVVERENEAELLARRACRGGGRERG